MQQLLVILVLVASLQLVSSLVLAHILQLRVKVLYMATCFVHELVVVGAEECGQEDSDVELSFLLEQFV